MATLCNDHVKRYSRQLIVPQFGLAPQISLRDATLLLVGCGGLGSSAAFYLASAGVGKIHLVDGDVVERYIPKPRPTQTSTKLNRRQRRCAISTARAQ
jgi:molybdopterin/thiamine biosynthesis adenylyltransferase